jgi:hypothetical protein
MDQQPTSKVPSPSPQPLVALDLPSAQLLADQVSMHQDLNFVQDCCKHLLAMMELPDDQRNTTMLRSLWTAALVAYARCFGTGRRFGLSDEDVEKLPLEGQVIDVHKWFQNMRNKHIAHSVNPFEIVKVGAVLSSPDQKERQVEGIGWLGMYYLVPDVSGIWQLGGLAARLAKNIEETIQAQQEVVLTDARQLNIDTLYALPDLRTTAPGPDDAGRARSKHD